MLSTTAIGVVLGMMLLLLGCGSDAENTAGVEVAGREAPAGDDTAGAGTHPAVDGAAVGERLEQIASEVDAWARSSTLEQARAHAEAAANLIVGRDGFGYGDRDGNGEISGAVEEGLLPGLSGHPAGLVLDAMGNAECVNRDVLGGDWDDPVQRWAVLAEAIDAWTPVNNTFPSLPSHPMRVVGWAELTRSGTFEEAIEYAGHAHLHVSVTRAALSGC